MISESNIQQKILQLQSQLKSVSPSLLGELDPAKYISLLDSKGPNDRYNQVPADLILLCDSFQTRYGASATEIIHKLALVGLISQFGDRTRGRSIPPTVRDLYRSEHDRILSELSANPPGFYSLSNDLFLKDLGLARTLLMPAGVEFIQFVAGVSRSVIWKGGFRQFISALPFFAVQLHGFGPFYEIHMDARRRNEFSPEARIFCYKIVAELLVLNKNVKGLLGGSWFYDPVLETISPHLAYLRRMPMQNGAKVFYFKTENDTSDALRYSRSRRRLFEQGQYQPKSYLLVWPRRKLIEWSMPKAHL